MSDAIRAVTLGDEFKAVFSRSPNAMAVIDSEGRYLRVNSSFVDLFEYSESELLQMSNRDTTHPDDMVATDQHRLGILNGKNQPLTIEKRYVSKTKKIIHAITSVTSVLDEVGVVRFFVVQVQDITEIRKAQEALVHSSKMVALGEMAAGIAHEINNPLTIIKGYADLIALMLTRKEQRLDEILEWSKQISATSIRMAKIVKGLRSFAREDDLVEYDFFSVGEVLEDAFSFCLERFKGKGVHVEIIGDQTLQIYCNKVGISQVLVNLLNNAYYAIRNEDSKWIKVIIENSDQKTVVSVLDSGPGVPIEIRNKIMAPFFTTKSPTEGSGLGLSISRGIIAAHEGELKLDEQSAHTKFDVILPAKEKPATT